MFFLFPCPTHNCSPLCNLLHSFVMIFDCVAGRSGLLLWRVICDALLLIVCLMRLYLYYSGCSGHRRMRWDGMGGVREPLKSSDWASPLRSHDSDALAKARRRRRLHKNNQRRWRRKGIRKARNVYFYQEVQCFWGPHMHINMAGPKHNNMYLR